MPSEKKNASVDDLTGLEALEILRRLWEEDSEIRDAVRREIEELVSRVVPEHITDAVLADLDSIAIEELWDRSGEGPLGYTHPADATWEIVQERLETYVWYLERYLRLEKMEEALWYCLGVLEGIYVFGSESDTEFLRWAEDDPREAFQWVLDRWIKEVSDDGLRQQMKEELKTRCPEWEVSGL